MQLHLETAELNLLADVLLAQAGGTSEHGQPVPGYEGLLNKVLAQDLRLDTEELDQVASVMEKKKRELTEVIAGQADPATSTRLRQKLGMVERVLEKVSEACVMF